MSSTQSRHSLRRFRPRVEELETRITPALAFAINTAGTQLLAFDTASPSITSTTTISGINANETLAGIDFRPQNGHLYGLGVNSTANTATLYDISTRTGLATAVGTTGQIAFVDAGGAAVPLPSPTTTGYGFDFNPAVDRVRVVAGGLNFRVNPNTGAPIDGDLGGAAGSVAGINPDGPINGGTTTVDDAAYTNDSPNNGNITTLYTLDSVSKSLYIQNPPNAGTQTNPIPITLNGNPLTFTAIDGFDIPAGVNAASSNAAVTAGSAFAVLSVGGSTGLYSINLVTGAATLVGTVGTGTTPIGDFAIDNDYGGFPSIALSSDGTSLLRFNSSTPLTTTTVSVSGVATGETLVGIDFRPATGQLYGLGVNSTANTATLYLIDPQTGAATAVGTTGQIAFTTDGTTVVPLPTPTTTGYGFNFNPTVDRIRVTSSTGLNFRVNPNTGAPVDGDNGMSTAVTGINPDGTINGLPTGSTGVGGTSYTNSFGQSLSGGVTTQYSIDATSGSIYIQNPSNVGTETMRLPISLNGAPLTFTAVLGFEVLDGVSVTTSASPQTAAQGGRALAALTVGGTTNVYSINLSTGVATLLGALGAGTTVARGLAVADAPAGTIGFSTSNFYVTNNAGTLKITATRSGGTNGSATVMVTVTGGTAVAGTDFSGTPLTLTFPDGSATATGTISLIDGRMAAANKTINLALSSPTGGATLGNVTTATVTIVNRENAPPVSAGVSYALSNNTLIAFDGLSLTTGVAPSTTNAAIPVTNLNMGDTLVGIAFRPQNGYLYGLGYNATAGTAQLYVISPQTGVANPVGATGTFVDGSGATVRIGVDANTRFGFNFNPASDRIRVTTNGGQNFRINPNTGAFVDGDLGGATGSVTGLNMDGAINGGATGADGAAYTSDSPNATATTLYTIDATTSSLYIQNPNTGTETLVGRITDATTGNPLTLSSVKGFVIQPGVNSVANNAPAAGSGLAILTVGGATGLFSIDLTSGKDNFLGYIGGLSASAPNNPPSAFQGLAFQSNAAGVATVGLNAAGTSLVRFNTATPTMSTSVAITGVAMGETLVGVDFRPATGQLYSLGVNSTANTGTLYILDPQTGVATAVGTTGQVAFVDGSGNPVPLPAPSTTVGYGLNFNPVADRVRVVTSTGLNFRVNPVTGAPVDGNLNMTTPPPGVNTDGPINGLPMGSTGVSATAYTNHFSQTGLTTQVTTQYTIDATSGSLYIQNTPNSGTETMRLPLTLNGTQLMFSAVVGFDIPANVTAPTSNAGVPSGTGYATLTVGGMNILYSINLATGATTSLGLAPTPLSALTVAQTSAGSVSFVNGSYSAKESDGTASITLIRVGGSSGQLTVTVTPTAGTAVAGTDFTATPVTVTFADGQTSATAMIPVLNDMKTGPNFKTVNLTLGNAVGGVVGQQNTATLNITEVTTPPTVKNPTLSVVGSGAGPVGAVAVYNADGTLRFNLTPYPGFTGGINTATADLNGDGVQEIITGPKFGGGPNVKVFNASTGAEMMSFFAFVPNFTGGVSVATLDIGNGKSDIVVAAGPGGGPHVRILDFSGKEVASFFAYDSGFSGGVSIATGDVTGDGVADLITGALNGPAHVKVFAGVSGGVPSQQAVRSFYAFDSTKNLGVNVAVSNGQIFAAPASSIADARRITPASVSLTSSDFDTVRVYSQASDATFKTIKPYPGFTGGIRIGRNSVGQIVTGAGPGGGPNVKVFDPITLAELASFFAFDPAFMGGVFVG